MIFNRARSTFVQSYLNTKYVPKHRFFGSMNVAIVGSGAVGGYYGSRLHQKHKVISKESSSSGVGVKFYMRNDHFKHCSKHGLEIKSVDGDFHIPPDELQLYDDTQKMGSFDWILISIKNSFLEDIPRLIDPLLKDDGTTRILAVMNGLMDDDLVNLLRERKCKHGTIYGGMAFICSNRPKCGLINHTSYGTLNCGLAFTPEHTCPDSELKAVEDLWKGTAVKCVTEPSLLRGRWEKQCFNLPFSGLSVAHGGISISIIARSKSLRSLADQLLDETIAIANADLSSVGVNDNFLGEKEV